MKSCRHEVCELMGATEKIKDLVRSYFGRRDAQGRQHVIAEDIRTSLLEALLLEDLENHVQLNRARLLDIRCLEGRNKNRL